MSKGYPNFYDRMMKNIASYDLKSFFLFFGLDCIPYFSIANEVVDGGLNLSLLDLPVCTSKGIVNFEFQFDRDEADDRRFIRYGVQLYEKYGFPVMSVVIDFKAQEDEPFPIEISKGCVFTIYVKSLNERNPDIVLNNINDKLAINEKPLGKDLTGLKLLPFLDLDRKIELLDKATEVLFSLDKNLVGLREIKHLMRVIMFYSHQWNYEENLDRLGRWSIMVDDLSQDAVVHFGKVNRKKGREERSYEVARYMIDDGFSAEDVSKYSRLDLSIVNQLMLMK
ncbi:hypothetical protein mru_0980 [Methanobrevibacter ruminantium M1]|uniref:Uncharacterized protein n=1 Tax=Methanobrevibacter ruminantium (strain ATCC 35063 / DSM 1093 / JCM 13430 / OCM 146 / M1) TaxID=634498 RepID=D3E2S0_METRM|nr:hypothetical protein [Methanobrevibacter ruminantium]ADC46831.1 hypothetical protein mru_0980 [Methanobrevibacter ruminantium M1]